MSKIFISYSRRSGAIAQSLSKDLEALGHTVWFDQELSGGQAWWDRILATIRDSDVIAVILDPDTLNSSACQLEYEYAGELEKPLLPILAADGVSTGLLPHVLSRIQYVDYRHQDRDAALRLARAFTALPAPGPLPDPLPKPPEAPLSYLGLLNERIGRAAPLTYEEQAALVVDLRQHVQGEESRDDARTLLERLRKRRDLFAGVADDIDGTLDALPSPKRSEPPPPPPPGERNERRWPARLMFAAGAAIAAAILAGLLIELDKYRGTDKAAVLTIVAVFWAIAGAIAGGRKQPTAYAATTGAAGLVVMTAVFAAMGELSALTDATVFGLGPGAVLGAVAGVVLERRRTRAGSLLARSETPH